MENNKENITEEINMQEDPAVEEIKRILDKDREIVDQVLDKIIPIITQEFKENNEFNSKIACLLCGKLLMSITQTFCKDAEEFDVDLRASNLLAVERIIPSLAPKVEDGAIAEENYDIENLSIKRIMMALATAIDYTFWKVDVNSYVDRRAASELTK